MSPQLSVIIPTFNRTASLLRLLHALAADITAPSFEVIVVDDGSSDDTLVTLKQLQPPFPLRVLSQSAGGPARARNAGANIAHGPVLLFFDDDVEPAPGTLAAHVAFHASDENLIGVGDLPPVVTDTSMFGVTLRGWWDRMLTDCRRPGHRFSFRNVLTGHLSVHRSGFLSLGGFDPELRCHEDWEFGYRAMKAGMRIRFVAGAAASHHETSNLAKVLRRKFEEGVADIQLAARHPELTRVLPFYWPPSSRKGRVLARAAWHPRLGRMLARVLAAQMTMTESVHLRGRWRAALDLLLTYWYWCGVASVMPQRDAVKRLPSTHYEQMVPELCVDLENGIERAERRLDVMNPASVAIFYGKFPVGAIHAIPGLEPLRGEHLRPMLALPYYRARLLYAIEQLNGLPPVLSTTRGDSTHARGRVPHMSAPVMRNEHLSTHLVANVDVQRRAAVPPIHHVA